MRNAVRIERPEESSVDDSALRERLVARGQQSRGSRGRGRLELRAVDEVVAIVDGAPWIRTQLQRFAGCDHIGRNFYHFSPHVAEAARACFGEGTPASPA